MTKADWEFVDRSCMEIAKALSRVPSMKRESPDRIRRIVNDCYLYIMVVARTLKDEGGEE